MTMIDWSGGGGDDPPPPSRSGKLIPGHYIDALSSDVWMLILEYLALTDIARMRGVSSNIRGLVDGVLTRYPNAIERVFLHDRREPSGDIRTLNGYLQNGMGYAAGDINWITSNALRNAARLDAIMLLFARASNGRIQLRIPDNDPIGPDTPGYQQALVLARREVGLQNPLEGYQGLLVIVLIALLAYLATVVWPRLFGS